MRIGDLCSYVCSADLAVSSAYALLIGDDRRKALAAYFTPPVLASATLDAIAQFLEAGQEPAILDPACGGGSFLVPTARRLVDMHIAAGHDIEEACGMALEQLSGIEDRKSTRLNSSH